MLTTTRGDILTIGVALAVNFASSGIESLRIGLNRAYGAAETQLDAAADQIDHVRADQTVALLALAFLIVLGR